MHLPQIALVACTMSLIPAIGFAYDSSGHSALPSRAAFKPINTPIIKSRKTGVPPGSYIKKPVTSTPDLVVHARNDPEIMSRYVSTYKMNAKAVEAALKDLRLTTLARPINANIYYVSKTGKVVYKYRKLRKGTSVFVSSTGRPAMLQSCGNPISAVLPTFNPLPPVPQMAFNPPLPEPEYLGDMEGFVDAPNQPILPDGAVELIGYSVGTPPVFAFPSGGSAGSVGPGQMDHFVDNPSASPNNPGFINLPPISSSGGGPVAPIVTVPEPGKLAFAVSVGTVWFWFSRRRKGY